MGPESMNGCFEENYKNFKLLQPSAGMLVSKVTCQKWVIQLQINL
jgi:hypothetical protein